MSASPAVTYKAPQPNCFSVARTSPRSCHFASCANMCGLGAAQLRDSPSSALLLLCRHQAKFWTGNYVWQIGLLGRYGSPESWSSCRPDPETHTRFQERSCTIPVTPIKQSRAAPASHIFRAQQMFPKSDCQGISVAAKVLKLEGLQNMSVLTDWGKHVNVLMVMSM